MVNSESEIWDHISNAKLLAVLREVGVPILVSGKIAERFHGCESVATSHELELILKPDKISAAIFAKSLGSFLRDFGLRGGKVEDTTKLSTPGFRFKPLPNSNGIDILVAENIEVFDKMLSRSSTADLDGLLLPVICLEDIYYLKQDYAVYWLGKHQKHLSDLLRLKEKLATQTG